jgi:hypothetical protein
MVVATEKADPLKNITGSFRVQSAAYPPTRAHMTILRACRTASLDPQREIGGLEPTAPTVAPAKLTYRNRTENLSREPRSTPAEDVENLIWWLVSHEVTFERVSGAEFVHKA